MNKVHLTGRVARDVTLKTTNKGQKMIRNAICVLKPFKDLDGKYGVDYIDFSLFDGKAEHFAQFINKGDFIEITGRLTSKVKETNENKIYSTELVVEHIGFGPKTQNVIN